MTNLKPANFFLVSIIVLFFLPLVSADSVLNCTELVARNLVPNSITTGVITAVDDVIPSQSYVQSYGTSSGCSASVNGTGIGINIWIYGNGESFNGLVAQQREQFKNLARDNAERAFKEDFITGENYNAEAIYRGSALDGTPVFGKRPSGYYFDSIGNCTISLSMSARSVDELEDEYPNHAALVAYQHEFFLREAVLLGEKLKRDVNFTSWCHGEVQPPGKCAVSATQVLFEPTQGVWQDDYFFADRVGKQLFEVDKKTYEAQIPMVKSRSSLLFGVRGAGKSVATDSQRKVIAIRGMTTGTTNVQTKLRFTLEQTSGSKVVYESTPSITIPLDEPCGPQVLFEVNYTSEFGLPEASVFTFDDVGQYTLTGELIRNDNGNATGVIGKVVGLTVQTFAPKVHFIPISISQVLNVANSTLLQAWTKNLSDASFSYITDYFPVSSFNLSTVRHPAIKYLRSTVQRAEAQFTTDSKTWGAWWNGFSNTTDEYRLSAVVSAITDEIATGAQLAGADRVIVVMPNQERIDLFGIPVQGYAASQKVIFVPVIARYEEPHDSVAHELTHTISYIWSQDEMQIDCGFNYHNFNWSNVSHGFRITYAGGPVVNRVHLNNGGYSLMGSETIDNFPGSPAVYDVNNYTEWIDQCTYAHLANELQVKPDPQLLLVRGMLARGENSSFARLYSAYNFEGESDISNLNKGNWTITLRGADNSILAEYHFEPQWTVPGHPHNFERNVLSFGYKVPLLPGTNSVEIRSVDGAFDAINISVNKPTVAIAPELNGSIVTLNAEGNVLITWSASDADNDNLLFTILYSSDGGANWLSQSFEQSELNTTVAINTSSTDHLAKVIATDGSHSSESIARFSTSKPATFDFSLIVGIVLLLAIAGGFYWYFKQLKRPKGL